MPIKKLKEFLDKNRIKYSTIHHSPAYTAQEIAEISHISAKELAKTVIMKVDDRLVMVVLPAHHKVSFEKIKQATKAKAVDLASELEFQKKFPGCELGAMPPFGNLFNMEVYVEKDLTQDPMIAFNAGSHSELIKLTFSDFAKLVKPQVI
ncbi:MAG: deacylase [Coxiella sp. RIFCSPHIGHO2_12_FULL_44_14]|nr:MAG: deacylase [Coxiella sp. RIFCSPHIGHO2_12_FULL_44_14]